MKNNSYKRAYLVLENLFQEIGWSERFNEAILEDCRNAYLHGMCDAAYDEWAEADEFVRILQREANLLPCQIEICTVAERFPNTRFRDDHEWGFQFERGRLFSLRDYCSAKEAIAALGSDRFAIKFRQRFQEALPINCHLW